MKVTQLEVTFEQALDAKAAINARILQIAKRITNNPRTPSHRHLVRESANLQAVSDQLNAIANIHFDAIRAQLNGDN